MPSSGMPSRSRLVQLAGDPRIAFFGRASRTRKLMMQGDPFLGGIIKALGAGLGFLAKKVVAPALGIQTPIPPSPLPPDVGPGFPFPPVGIGKSLPIPGTTSGKPFFPRTVPTGGISVGAAGGRRRRRMNPLNPRALRRALSRAGSFARFARRAMRITFGKTPKVRFRVGRKKRS